MTQLIWLITVNWKQRRAAFSREYAQENLPLRASHLPTSDNSLVGENGVLQLNILETGIFTLVIQNPSPTRLHLVGDKFCSPKRFGGEPAILTHPWLRTALKWKCYFATVKNTQDSFDWLINYINQWGTCFKIIQPITDNFTTLLLTLHQ